MTWAVSREEAKALMSAGTLRIEEMAEKFVNKLEKSIEATGPDGYALMMKLSMEVVVMEVRSGQVVTT